MRVVGVSVKAGVPYLVALEPATIADEVARSIESSTQRFERNAALDEAHQLVDLAHRIESYFRAQRPEGVAVARTRKFNGVAFADAYARTFAMCAVMAACVQCEIRFAEVTTESIAKRVGGGVLPKALGKIPEALFGYATTPTYWRPAMAEAHGAALTLLPDGTV